MRFSKEKWLEAANEQKEKGYVTQQEIEDALETWVNDFDGKTLAELDPNGDLMLAEDMNEAWFV